jgi:hypothetical protein
VQRDSGKFSNLFVGASGLLFRTEEKTGHRLMQFTWTRPFTFNHPCSHLLDATLCETGVARLTKVGSMNTFFPDVELEPPQSVKWGYYICFFLCTSPHVEPVQRRSLNLVGGPQLFYATNRTVQINENLVETACQKLYCTVRDTEFQASPSQYAVKKCKISLLY